MVDQIMFDLVDMDINLAEKFRNQSVALKVRGFNYRAKLSFYNDTNYSLGNLFKVKVKTVSLINNNVRYTILIFK